MKLFHLGLVGVLWSPLLAIELIPQNYFGTQFSQKIHYENLILQNGVPLLNAEGRVLWVEPFQMSVASTPWKSASLMAEGTYDLSPYMGSAELGLGVGFLQFFTISTAYKQTLLFAQTHAFPWSMERSQIDSLWSEHSVFDAIKYPSQSFGDLNQYQAFTTQLQIHGNVWQTNRFPWSMTLSHTFIDGSQTLPDRVYDFSNGLAIAKNDELVHLNVKISFNESSKWNYELSYDELLSMLKSGLVLNGDVFEPRTKNALSLRTFSLNLKHNCDASQYGIGLSWVNRNTNASIWHGNHLKISADWTYFWNWKISNSDDGSN